MILGRFRLFLKWLAVITMTVDHVGKGFFPQILFLPLIGRFAFPVFCFLLVLGFFSSMSLDRYLLRLFLFALVSQVPYCLFFQVPLFGELNIFFTLALALLFLVELDRGAWVFALLVAFSFYVLPLAFRYSTLPLVILFYFFFRFRYGDFQKFRTGVVVSRPLSLNKYFFYVYYPAHLLMLFVIFQWSCT